VLAAGWAVAIATSPRLLPVETASVDVTLAVGPAAPSTAVVEVAFLGAFVEQPKFVCALVRNERVYGRLSDVGVDVAAVALDPGVEVAPGFRGLGEEVPGQFTTRDLYACAQFTCVEAPCGGRLTLTLVDDADPSETPPPDPDRLEPVALQLVVAVDAAPGALPGEATITLVETLP
jgi:hypothetical protein